MCAANCVNLLHATVTPVFASPTDGPFEAFCGLHAHTNAKEALTKQQSDQADACSRYQQGLPGRPLLQLLLYSFPHPLLLPPCFPVVERTSAAPKSEPTVPRIPWVVATGNTCAALPPAQLLLFNPARCESSLSAAPLNM